MDPWEQFESVKAALVDRVTNVATVDNGIVAEVYPYHGALYARDLTGTEDVFYVTVTRNATSYAGRTMGDRGGKAERRFSFEIEVHLPWDRARGDALEILFDRYLEVLCLNLASDVSLAGPAGEPKLATLSLPQVSPDSDGFRIFQEKIRMRYRMVTLEASVTSDYRWRA